MFEGAVMLLYGEKTWLPNCMNLYSMYIYICIIYIYTYVYISPAKLKSVHAGDLI